VWALVGVVVALHAGVAKAGACEDDVVLQQQIDNEVRGLRIWSISWGSIYAVEAGVDIGIAIATNDPNARIDLTVGGISAIIGSLSAYLIPLRFTIPLQGPHRCEALEKVAEEQQLGRSWLGHVGNVAINAAVLMILGVGYHHWQSAFIGAGIGLAVGELTLWTQPAHLKNVLKEHQQRQIQLIPLVGPVNGLGVVMAF
jgi:hypothetical protein